MNKSLLFFTLALGISAQAAAEDGRLSKLDMSATNWISKSEFKDYSDDTRVILNFNANGFTNEVNNWCVGEIASAGQENKLQICYVTQNGMNTAELTVGQLKAALVGADNQDGLCWNVWNATKDEQTCTISRLSIEFYSVKQYGEEKSVAFDEYGYILASEFDGYSTDAQIKFTYTVTTTKGEQGYFNGWGVGKISDIGGSFAEGLALAARNEGDNVFVTTLGEVAELLTIIDSYNRTGLYWNVWSQGKDGNEITVTRKSVTIAEVKTDALAPIASDAEVVKTEYYNLAGVRSAEPSKGMNVVVRTMRDGTTQTGKLLVK